MVMRAFHIVFFINFLTIFLQTFLVYNWILQIVKVEQNLRGEGSANPGFQEPQQG